MWGLHAFAGWFTDIHAGRTHVSIRNKYFKDKENIIKTRKTLLKMKTRAHVFKIFAI